MVILFLVCKRITIYVLVLKMMSVWAVFTKLQPDFHSMCILEFHGQVVVTFKIVHVSVIL